MHQSSIHPKRHPFVLLPQPHHRFNSLKASHAYFTQHRNLTKRHSLDTRPTHNGQKPSFDNIQDYNLVTQPKWTSKGSLPRPTKVHHQEVVKIKYYWRGKSKPKEEKIKGRKVKGTWSDLGKHFGKKKKEWSRSKWEESVKINNSDRLQVKNQITNGKSNQNYHGRKEPGSGDRTKLTKSLLNSTMLTKRGSQSSKEQRYDLIFIRLRDILTKYEKKVQKLTDEKEYYRLKLKRLRRKKGGIE